MNATEKLCRKCETVKPLTEFHGMKRNSDGKQSHCKQCQVKAKIKLRATSPIYVLKERIASRARKAIRPSIRTAEQTKANNAAMRKKYPEKDKARAMLNNAIAAGQVVRGSCQVCGIENAEAHHPDYAKPLEVMWLCQKHHKELHVKINEQKLLAGLK